MSNSNSNSNSNKSSLKCIYYTFSPETIEFSTRTYNKTLQNMCLNAINFGQTLENRPEIVTEICREKGIMIQPNIPVIQISYDNINTGADKSSVINLKGEYFADVQYSFCNGITRMNTDHLFPEDPGYVIVFFCPNEDRMLIKEDEYVEEVRPVQENIIGSIATFCFQRGNSIPYQPEGTVCTIRGFCTNQNIGIRGFGWTIWIIILMATHVTFLDKRLRGFILDALIKAKWFWDLIGFLNDPDDTNPRISQSMFQPMGSSDSVPPSRAISRNNTVIDKSSSVFQPSLPSISEERKIRFNEALKMFDEKTSNESESESDNYEIVFDEEKIQSPLELQQEEEAAQRQEIEQAVQALAAQYPKRTSVDIALQRLDKQPQRAEARAEAVAEARAETVAEPMSMSNQNNSAVEPMSKKETRQKNKQAIIEETQLKEQEIQDGKRIRDEGIFARTRSRKNSKTIVGGSKTRKKTRQKKNTQKNSRRKKNKRKKTRRRKTN